MARTASGMRSGLHGRAGVGVTDPGCNHHSDFTNDFSEIVTRSEIPIESRCRARVRSGTRPRARSCSWRRRWSYSRRRRRCRCRRWGSPLASAVDVKHDVHVREANVPGRCRVVYTAIGRTQIAKRGFWVCIRTNKEQVTNTCSIRCRHFHHQLKR